MLSWIQQQRQSSKVRKRSTKGATKEQNDNSKFTVCLAGCWSPGLHLSSLEYQWQQRWRSQSPKASTQHLLISQRGTAYQNNVEAIRLNCFLVAPPFFYRCLIGRSAIWACARRHTNASHTLKRLLFSQCKNPWVSEILETKGKLRNWENTIFQPPPWREVLSQCFIQGWGFTLYSYSGALSMFALIFAFRMGNSNKHMTIYCN